MVTSTGTTASEREEEQDAPGLHLPDLLIQGFRGIDELAIPRLGRVTLLAGKNGAGKTTVLEAVRVYAARGGYAALSALLRDREEVFATTDEDGDRVAEIDWEALFHGRDMDEGQSIVIGPRKENPERIRIESIVLDQAETDRLRRTLPGPYLNARVNALQVSFRDKTLRLPHIIVGNEYGRSLRPGAYLSRRFLRSVDSWPVVDCESFGPELPTNTAMSEYWDNVALTDDEERVVQALRMIHDGIDRVAMVGDGPRANRGRQALYRPAISLDGRQAIVKLAGHDDPVPLRSLGDGARRLFGVALALANSRDGFLLIDEAENGIHHSVQPSFWRMILGVAQANNVQVLATTHSWDCVRGFAQAAMESDAEGVLVRVERSSEKMRAIEYTEEGLRVVAEQGIEVR